MLCFSLKELGLGRPFTILLHMRAGIHVTLRFPLISGLSKATTPASYDLNRWKLHKR